MFFQQQERQFQQTQEQGRPFTAFNPIQQGGARNGQLNQNPSTSFQRQGQGQFIPEIPRSSQQFQGRPQLGVFDQIRTAIDTGRRFSAQAQIPQSQRPINQALPPTTTPPPPPPPKFMPLNAVPKGSEQIETHRKLEETVRASDKIMIKEAPKEAKEPKEIQKEMPEKILVTKPGKLEKNATVDDKPTREKEEEETKISKDAEIDIQESAKKNIEGLIRNVVTQAAQDNSKKEKERLALKKEKESIIGELNNILDLLSHAPATRSESKNDHKKASKKSETSLIRIQENLLGLSGISKEDISKENDPSKDISNLLGLLQKVSEKKEKPSKKKLKIKSNDIIADLEEKILKLSSQEDDSHTILEKSMIRKEEVEENEEDEDLSAVQTALSTLLGSNPSEESKLSPDVFSVVLKLDKFFQQEEKQKAKKVDKVENLVDTALGFINGAVTHREHAEKRLIDGEPVLDYEDYLDEILEDVDLTPAELSKLLKSSV